jgi:GT2 family glycosyltransferase
VRSVHGETRGSHGGLVSLAGLMETMAPPVVVVVVTHDPGEWFEGALEAIGAQDYPEMSVLVLDADSTTDPTSRVAEVLPGAFVRRLETNGGFAASANEALSMVEGADFLVFCHDDVAPDPTALRYMVEEAYRSNAGVVGPKFVDWADPTRLLHVGLEVDKTGATVDRVERGEVDHGQHDGVRDVFCASGGFTLVRRDMFVELGGFDAHVAGMSENLDLCWRAQIAGARVMVCPEARVRHLELLASGARQAEFSGAADIHTLQRRGEVHAALKAYGPVHRVRVLPQMLVLSIAEMSLLTAMGHVTQAKAVAGAWRWNLGLRSELRRERAAVQRHRRIPDSEVRGLQMRGSARARRVVSRAFSQGVRAAHRGPQRGDTTGTDVADRTSRRSYRVAAWVVLFVVVAFGIRQLLTGGLPELGGFLRLPSSGSLFSQFSSGQHRFGIGATAPATPATLLLGIAGYVLFGSWGLLQTLLVAACIPIGAFGVARLCRPLGRPWSSFLAAACYLAFPIAYEDMAAGRFESLVTYAAMPWLLLGLAKSTSLEPFSSRRPVYATLGLGMVLALTASFDPPVVVATAILSGGMALGIVITSGTEGIRAAARLLATAVGALVVSTVLLVPWSTSVLASGAPLKVLAGVRSSLTENEGFSVLVRTAVGPIAAGLLVFGLVAAAVLPLLIGRGWRLGWSGRAWLCASGGCFAALAADRGWLGSFASDPSQFLPIAACSLSFSVALGIAAFRLDLPESRFGWRQLVSVLAAVAGVVGAIPVFVSFGGGRLGLPPNGFNQVLSWMGTQPGATDAGTVWVGDSAVVPGGSWPMGGGLAYTVSNGGIPDLSSIWQDPPTKSDATVAEYLTEARAGKTVDLGHRLASQGVKYVIVVGALAPDVPGLQNPEADPAPGDLVPALNLQTDLKQLPTLGGYEVYEDPEFTARAASTSSKAPSSLGWEVAGGILLWAFAILTFIVTMARRPAATAKSAPRTRARRTPPEGRHSSNGSATRSHRSHRRRTRSLVRSGGSVE